MNTSEHSTTQGELEKLVSDLRGLLANKDLDVVPEIKLLRQRLTTASTPPVNPPFVQRKTPLAKDAAIAADRYAHDEPWRVAGAAWLSAPRGLFCWPAAKARWLPPPIYGML